MLIAGFTKVRFPVQINLLKERKLMGKCLLITLELNSNLKFMFVKVRNILHENGQHATVTRNKTNIGI